MIPITDVHEFIRGTLKKNYGAFVSPGDIDRAVNRAQYDLFDQLVDNYRKSKEFEYDHLFLSRETITLSSVNNGVKVLPSDYSSAVGFYFKDSSNNLHEGELLKWDEFLDRKSSAIAPPTVETSSTDDTIRPIATIFWDGLEKIEFAPRPTDETYTFILVYFREPQDAEFVYTESNGVITAAPFGAQTNLQWDKRQFSDIVTRALMYLGFPIKDGQAIQLEAVRDSNQLRDGNN
jgi:hypothetical protein